MNLRYVSSTCAVTIAAALAVPAGALADATCSAYNPQTCSISGVTGSQGPGGGPGGGSGAGNSATATVRTGSLPFTGLDAALLAGGGVLLVGVGAGVRRAVSPSTQRPA